MRGFGRNRQPPPLPWGRSAHHELGAWLLVCRAPLVVLISAPQVGGGSVCLFLLSVSVTLTPLGIPWEWDHTAHVLLCLAYVTEQCPQGPST